MGYCLQCHAFEGHFKCCKHYVEPEAEKTVEVQFAGGTGKLTRAQLVAGLKELDEAEPPKSEFKAGDRVQYAGSEHIILSKGAHGALAKGWADPYEPTTQVAVVGLLTGWAYILNKIDCIKISK